MQSTSIPTTPCTIWTGALQSGGYGSHGDGNGRTVLAHRAAWERQRGPIPDGLTVDHLCRERRCINVEHMELVTNAENARRMVEFHREARRDESGVIRCKRGHAQIGDNVRVYVTKAGHTKNKCKECGREDYRTWYHRQKAAGTPGITGE